LGIFAARPILRGTCVLNEAPLLTIESGGNRSQNVLVAYRNLTSEQRIRYLSLEGYVSNGLKQRVAKDLGHDWERLDEEVRRILSIAGTNALADTGDARVYDQASRFNHSCVANVGQADDKFYAITDIQYGQELTINYGVRPSQLRHERRKYILDNWGFHCECKACSDPESDKRRKLFIVLARCYDAVQAPGRNDPEECLGILEGMMAVIRSEGWLDRELTEW
jgi:hypothetical protein